MLLKTLSYSALCAGLFVGGLSLFAPATEACIHPAKTFEYPLRAGAQRGIIFFHDGREELILRPSYQVEVDKSKIREDGTLPGLSTLAWIVPLPSLPDRYTEADDSLVTDLQKFAAVETERQWRGGTAKGADRKNPSPAEDGAEFHEEVKVGNYTIQPIKASGEKGGIELNAWLDENGFGKVADATLKHYLDKGYYWLAVKLHKSEGLPANGTVKPLQISFATDKPVYPLKINAGRGTIDLEMWLFIKQKLDVKCLDAYGLWLAETEPTMGDGAVQKNRETAFDKLPESARKALEGAMEQQKALRPLKEGPLYCYRIFGRNLDEGAKLSKLEKDLEFRFEAAK